jgi:hypothetical protein
MSAEVTLTRDTDRPELADQHFTNGDEYDYVAVWLIWDRWQGMGSPDRITVTIEGADK